MLGLTHWFFSSKRATITLIKQLGLGLTSQTFGMELRTTHRPTWKWFVWNRGYGCLGKMFFITTYIIYYITSTHKNWHDSMTPYNSNIYSSMKWQMTSNDMWHTVPQNKNEIPTLIGSQGILPISMGQCVIESYNKVSHINNPNFYHIMSLSLSHC